MFLLIILFGLAALGLALALYLQADIPHKPLPPAQVRAKPATPVPSAPSHPAMEAAPAKAETADPSSDTQAP